MLQLHEDLNFHYEAMRALASVPHGGADITEILAIMPKIKPGDFDSWYEEWFQLAERVLSTIDETKEASYSTVTLRNVYFRASHYFFVADFFLHGNKNDPRMIKYYELWRRYFDKANALLEVPGKHYNIDADGFTMPAIIFRAAKASAENPRPTLIIGGGFESNMEETYHVFAVPALERGYNVVIYEGKIGSLRRFKDDVSEVKSGFECGIGFEKYNDLKVGDVIEVFAMERVLTIA